MSVNLNTDKFYLPKNDINWLLRPDDRSGSFYGAGYPPCLARIVSPNYALDGTLGGPVTVVGSNGLKRPVKCMLDNNNNFIFEPGALYRGTLNTAPIAVLGQNEMLYFTMYTYVPANVSGDVTVTLTANANNNIDPNLANNSTSLQSKIYNSDMQVDVARLAGPITNSSDQTFEVTVKNNGPTEFLAPSELRTKVQSRLTFKEFLIPDNDWNCSFNAGNILCTYIPGNFPVGLESKFKVVLTYNNI